jgi:phosphorylated CTD-interacting factor 1
LRRRWTGDPGDESAFVRAADAVLDRYDCVMLGISHGLHMGIPDSAASLLLRAGVDTECFASPMNVRLPHYFGGFPDVDRSFGSLGDFFAAAPRPGAFEANPPFTEPAIARLSDAVDRWLAALPEAPLCFVVFLPMWSDCQGVGALRSRAVREVVLPAGRHAYRSGDPAADSRLVPASAASLVLAISTPSGMSKWPDISGAGLRAIAGAMSRRSPH